MNPLHELNPKLPPTYEESARKIREQLAAEKLGKAVMKGETDGSRI